MNDSVANVTLLEAVLVCFDGETATGYLRGDLEPDESALCAAHLNDCTACQALLREVAELIDSVRRDLMVAYAQPPALDRRRMEGVLNVAPRQRLAFSLAGGVWHSRLLSTISLAVFGLLGWWWVSRLGHTSVSAQELLRASASAEAAELPEPGIIAHRTYTIRTRRLPTSEEATTQHVEVWIDPAASVKVRRLFDHQRRLMAGEWTNPDGSRVIYRRGEAPERERRLDRKPLVASAIWRWELSAREFSILASGIKNISAQQLDDGFSLAFASDSGPVAASELTLDPQHLPVTQRIVLREGDGTLVEFTTAQQQRQHVPAALTSSAFQPDAELMPTPAKAGTVASKPAVSTAVPLNFDQLELNATYALYLAKTSVSTTDLDSDPQPCLVRGEWRTMPNAFHLDIVLRSEMCRAGLTPYLSPLSEEPRATVRVSVLETPQTGEPIQSPDAEGLSASVRDAALYPVLRDGIARLEALHGVPRLEGDRESGLDTRIQQFVNRWWNEQEKIAESSQELQHASLRWPPNALGALERRERLQWLRLARLLLTNSLLLRLQNMWQLTVAVLDPSYKPPKSNEQGEDRLRGPETDHDLGALFGGRSDGPFSGLHLGIAELHNQVAAYESEMRRLLSPRAAHGTETLADGTALLTRLRQILRLADFLATIATKLEQEEGVQ